LVGGRGKPAGVHVIFSRVQVGSLDPEIQASRGDSHADVLGRDELGLDAALGRRLSSVALF
jgi:hypothetical protein